MSAADNLVLQVTNLTSQYGKVTALNGANINVARGRIVTVIYVIEFPDGIAARQRS
jgi:ABC-type branched-subunit amino acid transport system ATPase component